MTPESSIHASDPTPTAPPDDPDPPPIYPTPSPSWVVNSHVNSAPTPDSMEDYSVTMTSSDDNDHTAPPIYAPSISGLQLLMSAIDPAPDPVPTHPISPIFEFSQDGELRAVYPTSSNAGLFAPDPPFVPDATPLQTFPSEATSEGDQSFHNDSFL